MKYLSLIARYVFARTLVRTDILSAVASALIPAVFYAAGKPMPDDIMVTVSLWLAGGIGLVVILRLIVAPYVIWKRDQAEIAHLREIITDSSTRRRHFFENEFLADRAHLAKDLANFAVLMPREADMETFDADNLLQPLTRRAVLFLGDANFSNYWNTFCTALRQSLRGAKFKQEHIAELTAEEAERLSKRFKYDFEAMRIAANALIQILTETLTHRAYYEEAISALSQGNDDVTFESFHELEASLWTRPIPQSPLGIEGKKPQ